MRKLLSWQCFRQKKTMFQVNTNASLNNLETQVGQLALTMQNQSKDSFPSDTKKNPNDCMAITLRVDKELKGSKEARKKHIEAETEKAYHNSTSSEKKHSRNGLSDEAQQLKEQGEVAKEETVQNEEVKAYQPPTPFP